MGETSVLKPIEKVESHTSEELFEKLRQVTMLKDQENKVYEHATINLKTVHYSEMSPPQRYVHVEQIKLLQELDFALKEKGYNLFQLNGYLEIWFEGAEKPVGIIPPILEKSIENDGSKHWIICDGMHRCYLARATFTPVQVIQISNVPAPYYAYPNPDGWSDVELIYQEAKGILKKFHRIADNKKLYRNFVPQFGNLSVPRGKV